MMSYIITFPEIQIKYFGKSRAALNKMNIFYKTTTPSKTSTNRYDVILLFRTFEAILSVDYTL